MCCVVRCFFKKGDSVTCSKECFAKLNSIKVSRPVIKICPECEKEFVTIPYYKDKLTFCSMECKNNYHSKIMSLDGNPRWIGGCSDKYDFKFTTELKEQVRNRDNNCCRLCGLTNEENIEFYKGSLPIHHIDYNKQNSSINNLITLCNSCHAKTNANRKQWKEKTTKIKSIRKLDIKPDKVYNIEVKDNNNYFVSNILVHNSANIIIDESAEIPDYMYSKIFRMTTQTRKPFLMELGNPWFRNHFWRASKDSGEPESEYFFQLFFDDNILVEQGRFTWEQLELAKLQDDYDVLFRCLFPSADIIDKEGYMPLFTKKFIDDHITKNPYMYGKKRLGVDVSILELIVIVMSYGELAKMIKKDH